MEMSSCSRLHPRSRAGSWEQVRRGWLGLRAPPAAAWADAHTAALPHSPGPPSLHISVFSPGEADDGGEGPRCERGVEGDSGSLYTLSQNTAIHGSLSHFPDVQRDLQALPWQDSIPNAWAALSLGEQAEGRPWPWTAGGKVVCGSVAVGMKGSSMSTPLHPGMVPWMLPGVSRWDLGWE